MRDLLTEASRNVAASPVRTVLLGVAVGTLAVGAIAPELWTVGNIADRAERARVDGQNVIVVGSDSNSIPLARCERLSELRGVARSGGLRLGGLVDLATAPGLLVQTADITTGLVPLWSDGTVVDPALGVGWIAGAALAKELHLRPAGLIETRQHGVARLAAVAEVGIRNPTAERWLLSLSIPRGYGSECWIEFQPSVEASDDASDFASAQFVDVGDLEIHRLLAKGALSIDLAGDLRARTSANLWLPCALVAITVLVLATRSRRAELGLYRAMGVSSVDLWLLAIVETAIVVVPTAAIASAWVYAFDLAAATRKVGVDEMSFGLAEALGFLMLVLALSPIAWVRGGRHSILEQMRDH